MEKLKQILTNALLAFALISTGFALGKHAVKPDVPADPQLPTANGRQIAVYYLHSTFRCVTCNTIESMTKALLDSTYSDALAAGAIQWHEVDFSENTAMAKQFEIVASCVVVAEMKDGIVTDYKRLDDVWTLMEDPAAFNAYISTAIDGYLKKTGGGV
ncbi:MAG TPA: hypothetical protein DCS43_07540 [Verrucomicrobia bacterium]|nr:hypothetical protein [Verrucomicrobiota bacterium]